MMEIYGMALFILFLFIQVKNVARLVWTLLVLELFLVILETLACLLVFAVIARQLDAFRLLTKCSKDGRYL